MSPRSHFADYAKRYPKDYQTFSDNLWNSFVSVTHAIGLSNYFSFTPDFLGQGEDLDPTALGRELGAVYNLAQGTQEETN